MHGTGVFRSKAHDYQGVFNATSFEFKRYVIQSQYHHAAVMQTVGRALSLALTAGLIDRMVPRRDACASSCVCSC
jgi:hypothetical protein